MKDVEIRYSTAEDTPFLRDWLTDNEILRNFPMQTSLEITDTINRWMSYLRFGSCLTAVHRGVPIGMSLFWLNFYRRIKHQALLTLIVDPKYRGMGVGGYLLDTLLYLGKKNLGIQLAHLEVYEGNKAIHLYKRKGFTQVGFQKKWMKDKEEYIGRIMMVKEL